MFFIDGENLAIRYKEICKTQTIQVNKQVRSYDKNNVYVWTQQANAQFTILQQDPVDVIRKYYYTSVIGSDEVVLQVKKELIDLGIEAPRVFNKKKGKRSKRVDISLSTEMLSHAHYKNYDIAVLIAGDEDYVPLVDAVMNEGCRVYLWFFEGDDSGLSEKLKMKVDYFYNIGQMFFNRD